MGKYIILEEFLPGEYRHIVADRQYFFSFDSIKEAEKKARQVQRKTMVIAKIVKTMMAVYCR